VCEESKLVVEVRKLLPPDLVLFLEVDLNVLFEERSHLFTRKQRKTDRPLVCEGSTVGMEVTNVAAIPT
jgi:hypothetical protein